MRRRAAIIAYPAIIALAVAGGCLRQAEDRARGDEEVGTATLGQIELVVSDGLAHVTSIASGAITLWSQSPVLFMKLGSGPDAATDWTIEVDNCMPDAELTATVGGAPVAVTALGGPRPTLRSWLVSIPANAEVDIEIAPPDWRDQAAWRFVVMGDIQTALGDVHEVFAVINAVPDVRFVVSTGDLVESADESEYELLIDQYETLDVPYYSTIGNHELFGDSALWRERFGRFNLHFDFKSTTFSLADSGAATIDPVVYGWLEDWIAEAANRTHLFFTHFPPLDPVGVRSGSFRSRREANKLLQRLAAGNVDVTFYGHIHSYYEFENAGIPAYISGGGGAWPETLDGIGRHFLVVDIDDTGVPAVSVTRVD